MFELSSAGGSQPVQGIHVRPRRHATLEVRRRSANGRSRSTSLMAGPWKSGLLLVTRFNPADKRNIGMKQIILPVAVVGLAIGGTLAFAQVNPSAPPAPQSMHQPAPAVDAPRAAKKTVTALSDLKTTTKVKAALLGDELTAYSHIHVSTAAGVVTLSGNVLSPYVAARAEQLAKQTEGVKEVVNNLKLSRS
jgi:BON domain